MVNQLSQDQLKIRYLLHGDQNNFNNQDCLYLLSESDELWEKVARQLFAQNDQSWRIIDKILADQITRDKIPSLNIEILSRDSVIEEIKKDIYKNSKSSLDVELLELTSKEREDILSEIGKNQQNKDYWLKLPLHETLDDQFISISGDRIYLENPNFLVPEELKPIVTIIKRSETLDQKWITTWTPKIAIDIILEQDDPSQYCQIILDCLSELNDQQKSELKSLLKTKSWLINKQNQSVISPNNVLYISANQLQNYTDKIVDLNRGKYSVNDLDSFILEHSEYNKWLISDLFDQWNSKKILKFVLKQNNPEIYWEIILDAVTSLNYNLDPDIENLIKNTNWLPIKNGTPKKPEEIVDLAPIKPLEPLKKYLPTLVKLSEDAYASVSMLLAEMQEHKAFNWLKEKKYFLTWDQNNIIKHLLKDINYDNQQDQIVFEIIVETLQLWKGIENDINKENINLLKTRKWLLDDNHIKFSPDQVLYSISLESDIENILTYADSTYYTIACEFSRIRKSQFLLNWIKNKLFISDQKEILKIIANLLKNIEDYWIGNFSVKEFPLHHFVQVFQDIDNKNFDFPVWSLAQKLREEEFKILLPSVVKQISYEKLVSIFNWISNQYSHRPNKSVVEVYNKYLELAVDNQYQFSLKILPEIKLLNHYKEWKQADKLAYEVEGIDYDEIIDDTQLQIIRPYLPEIFEPTEDQDTNDDDQDQEDETKRENKFSLIQEYFEQWQSHIQHELIGSFICLLIDDDEKELKNLAHSYLRNRGLPEVKKRLFEYNKNAKTRNFSITIRPAQNTLKSVPSLTGTYFNAKLSSRKKPPHLFEGIINFKTFDLQLIPIDPNEFNSGELSNFLKISIKILLEKVYQIQPKSLDAIWKDLQESDQISIENARDLILEDSVVYLLRQLGVDKINKEIRELLQEYRQQRQFHNDKKRRGLDTKIIDETMQYILKKLRQTLEDEHNYQIRLDILKCVRETINQYGYEPQSIPLEIFQNADDAVVELQQMLPEDNLEEDRYNFIIFWTDKELAFMHWGRPINLFRHPNYPKISYKNRGFDSDLEKMLAFNISDKPAGEGITGKFGLGFKSVYLLSDKPSIVSGNLGFEVIGGLLPTKLHLTKIEKLQNKLQKHTDLYDGTIISLPIDSKLNINVENIINEFKSWICLLTIFARAIKSIKICGNQTKQITYSWNPIKLLGINNIELGEIEKQAKVICFKLTKGASLLIGIDEKSINILKNVSSVWVTAPTQEKLNLGFILNAPFDVTTGRDSLSKLSQKNLTLAQNIGFEFGQQLYHLFFTAHNNWTKFEENLGIKISEYDFWHSIWDNLAVSWLSKDSNDTLNIIRLILGNENGIAYLITKCPSLPNGLWGNHRQLVCVNQVRYLVTGILSKQQYFKELSTWANFQSKYKPDQILIESVWENVKQLLGNSLQQKPKQITLIDVLKAEISNNEVNPKQSEYLGKLITSDFLQQIINEPEYEKIKNFLQNLKFLSKANNYNSANQLLVNSSNNEEEKLLVSFAPPTYILDSKYLGNGIEFFLVCHKHFEININELITWAKNAITENQRKSVRQYLLSGKQSKELIKKPQDLVFNSWMENDQLIRNILNLQSQIESSDLGNNYDSALPQPQTDLPLSNEEESKFKIKKQNNSNQLLLEIYKWWQENYQREIVNYNQRIYPIEIDELKNGLQNEERSIWLMLFFLGITHTMGRTNPEQHRNFIKFCIEKTWWDKFSAINPQEHPEKWLKILDDYLAPLIHKTEWYYWMEKYLGIYQVSKYLDDYKDLFLGADRFKRNFDLNELVKPRSSSEQSGGGLNAPPLRIGIGGNFVIRELIRLEIIAPTNYIYLHCFVPRQKVRKIMIYLGCERQYKSNYQYSIVIYNFLQAKFKELNINENPTFKNCFDIAFDSYLEHHKDINLRDIQIQDDIGLYDDIDDDVDYIKDQQKEGDFVTLSNGRRIPRSYMN